MTTKKIFSIAQLLVLALIIAVGISYTHAWTAPPGAPTTCPSGYPGCDAPLNVGSSNQIKIGGLVINGSTTAQYPQGLEVWGTSLFHGALQIADGTQGAGKVLTSDASGNTSWAVATATTAATMSPLSFDVGGGSYTAILPAGTYYISMWGAGGGAGGAQSGSGSADAGAGGGGGFLLARCTFTASQNNLTINVGAGGNFGYGGRYGRNGGSSTVSYLGSQLLLVGGGSGGIGNGGGGNTGAGGNSYIVSSLCQTVGTAAGGAGGPNAATSGSGGGGAGYSGVGGTSSIAGHGGLNGAALTGAALTAAQQYTPGVGGTGGIGNGDSSDSAAYWGYPGSAPGGGGGASSGGAPGAHGADGRIFIMAQ